MGLAKHYGHKHGGRETGPALDPHRLLDQSGRVGQHAPVGVHGRPVSQSARDGSHGHTQVHRHRRAGAISREQARPVRPQEYLVARLRELGIAAYR